MRPPGQHGQHGQLDPAPDRGRSDDVQQVDRRVKVAAFGDSAMWGQGLPRDRRFAALICARLGEESGRGGSIVWD